MKRDELFDALDIRQVTIPGAEFLTDEKVERAYQVWVKAGRPKGATIAVSHGANGDITIQVLSGQEAV